MSKNNNYLNFDIDTIKPNSVIWAKNGTGKSAISEMLLKKFGGALKISAVEALTNKWVNNGNEYLNSWNKLINDHCNSWLNFSDNKSDINSISKKIITIIDNYEFIKNIKIVDDSILLSFLKPILNLKKSEIIYSPIKKWIGEKDEEKFRIIFQIIKIIHENDGNNKSLLYYENFINKLQETNNSIVGEIVEIMDFIDHDEELLKKCDELTEGNKNYRTKKLMSDIEMHKNKINELKENVLNKIIKIINLEFKSNIASYNTYNGYHIHNRTQLTVLEAWFNNFFSFFEDTSNAECKVNLIIEFFKNYLFFENIYISFLELQMGQNFWKSLDELIKLEETTIVDLEKIFSNLNNYKYGTNYKNTLSKFNLLFFDKIKITSMSMIDKLFFKKENFTEASLFLLDKKVAHQLSDGEKLSIIWMDLYIKSIFNKNQTFIIDDSTIAFDEKNKWNLILLLSEVIDTNNNFYILTHDMGFFDEFNLFLSRKNSKKLEFKIMQNNNNEIILYDFKKNTYSLLNSNLCLSNFGMRILFYRNIINKFMHDKHHCIDFFLYKGNIAFNKMIEELEFIFKINIDNSLRKYIDKYNNFDDFLKLNIEDFSYIEKNFWLIFKILIIKIKLLNFTNCNSENKVKNIKDIIDNEKNNMDENQKSILRYAELLLPLICHPTELNIYYYINLSDHTLEKIYSDMTLLLESLSYAKK